MVADRPHRPKLSPWSILHELRNEAGKQFAPFLVLKLLDIIESNKLLEINNQDLMKIRAELLKTYAGPEL